MNYEKLNTFRGDEMRKLLNLLHLNKQINIFCICKDVALVEIDGKFAIAEKNKTKLGSTINYHFMDKFECNLVFEDYKNQVLYKDEAKLNFKILEK